MKKIVCVRIEDVVAFEEMLQRPVEEVGGNYEEEIAAQILGMKKVMFPAVGSPHMTPRGRSKLQRQPTIIKTFSSLRKSKP